jgi:hypothetical protein
MMADDDLDGDLAGIQFERIDAGRYVVAGEIMIDGKRQVRRIPCNNPLTASVSLTRDRGSVDSARVREG